jgi:hypothetical protein
LWEVNCIRIPPEERRILNMGWSERATLRYSVTSGWVYAKKVIECDYEVGNSSSSDGVRGFVDGGARVGDVGSIVAFDTSILSIRSSAGTHDVHQSVLGMLSPLAIIKNITDNNRMTEKRLPGLTFGLDTLLAPFNPSKLSATSRITLILPISASSTSSDETHAEIMSGSVTNVSVSSTLA